VSGSYRPEVLAVERRDTPEVEALGRSDYRGVHGAQRQIATEADQLCDAKPIARQDRFDAARSPRNGTSESVPCRVLIKYATSVTTRVGTISGPGTARNSSRDLAWLRSSAST
jgi:hypothetical protein